MTPAQLWAPIVDSRFSVAKYCHVFRAAEACKCCWLGVGCRGFLGLARSILVVGRQFSQTLWPGHRPLIPESARDEGPVARPLFT